LQHEVSLTIPHSWQA